MIATIRPSRISGNVYAPSAKSTMQRACALALLNNGITTIYDPGNSNDETAALRIVESAGATVTYHTDYITIESEGIINNKSQVDCGESGLALRMFLPVLALTEREISITGHGTLLNRPFDLLANLLPSLGVQLSAEALPLHIKGPLIPADITIDGSGSSQYLTGLLFAFANAATVPVRINVSNLVSRPYVDLSLQMLQHFSYDVTHQQYEQFTITPVSKAIKHIVYRNERDWSAAAILLVGAAIAGSITITGLDIRSLQADRAIVEVLQSCGADVISNEQDITVRKSRLSAFNFDATDAPDLFPALAVLACHCNGTSVIAGTQRLRTKESDRLRGIAEMIEVLGGDVTIGENELHIKGVEKLKGGCAINTYNDHRIVMAAAIAALSSTHDVTINDADAVAKSYPRFFDDMKMLGASVSLLK